MRKQNTKKGRPRKVIQQANAKIAFTGSTEVGRSIREATAGSGKKLTLELGGKSPNIVFDDADLDAAVAGAMASKYRNAGQTCVCSNRLFVQEGIYDAFVAKLVKATAELTVGDGLKDGIAIGPLVNTTAVNDVHELVSASVDAGAKVALGGGPHELGGSFYQPTVLTEVTSEMAVFRNEIFGPVAPVVRFSTEEEAKEAIEKFNDHELGGRRLRVNEAEDRPRRAPGPRPGGFSPSYGDGFQSGGGGGAGGGGGGAGYFGGGGGRRGGERVFRGADLQYNLELTLEEAVHGKTVKLRHSLIGDPIFIRIEVRQITQHKSTCVANAPISFT